MTAEQAFLDIVKNGVLEDRREYDREMLQEGYGLCESEAEALYQHIQVRFQASIDDVVAMPAQDLKDILGSALIDTYLEGWTETQVVTIESFLLDLVVAYRKG